MRRTLLHLTFGIYCLFLIGIIALANCGQGFWAFLGEVPLGDKLGHFGLVGTLTVLLNLVLRGKPAPGWFRGVFLGSLLAATAMTLEELSQTFLPRRSLDVFDWLANMAGVVAGEFAARRMLLGEIRQANR